MGASETHGEQGAVLTVVERSENPARVRVGGGVPDEVIERVRAASDPGAIIVAVDDMFAGSGFDEEAFIAFASVLVCNGVCAFETRYVQTIRRLFDMHDAIEAGSIEVLN